MAKYKDCLPQLSTKFFITDGGIETTLIFHENLDLPDFAAFYLLKDAEGVKSLRKYFRTYASLAQKYKVGFVLESPTWRANSDWGAKLGYSETALAEANQQAIKLVSKIRNEFENNTTKIVISGCVGPRGDGYNPTDVMNAEEAKQYHMAQIKTFSETDADMITAITMNYVEESIGIARAAKSANMPSAISFTVETDGKLPTGQTLKDAIENVDEATSNAPAYYMINCAHPLHFADTLIANESWTKRIRGLRANASTKSHTELNESTELDEGNPLEFGRQHRELLNKLKNINILGGCCGTDHRHIEEICKAVLLPA